MIDDRLRSPVVKDTNNVALGDQMEGKSTLTSGACPLLATIRQKTVVLAILDSPVVHLELLEGKVRHGESRH
jgi:hypothetical protein